jgi:drug/metabolite transporter (DMT)-like permease
MPSPPAIGKGIVVKDNQKVILAFATVYVVWGSTYLAIRVGAPYMPAALFAAARFIPAAGVMLLVLSALRRPIIPSRRDLLTLVAAGLLLLVGGNGLVVLAEQTVPSGLAALVVATVPLWIAGMEAVLPGGERLAPRGLAGLFLGLAGLVILSWPQLVHAAGQAANPVGLLTVVAASFFWAAGTLVTRRRPLTIDPFAATGWEMAFGGLGNLLLGLTVQARTPITWNAALFGSLAYLAVFGSIVAFSAYVWLLQRVPAAKVATYAYVNPVIAVFLGWWLLHETLDAYGVAGMVVILLAVVLVTTAKVAQTPASSPLIVE